MKWGFPFGISVIFWSVIGLIRWVFERRNLQTEVFDPQDLKKVAVCIPAHNEETVLQKTISSIPAVITKTQIHVVSDGSTDNTTAIATAAGVSILRLKPGRGKAGALQILLKKYKILTRYQYVLFLDADTFLTPNYFQKALPLIKNPKVAAVATYVINNWGNPPRLSTEAYFMAYWTRLFRLLQFLIMYAQTSLFLNTSPIIPGFAAFYKTSVLKKIQINTPGMTMEDFNMTFQVRKKKLGLIAHHPKVAAYVQESSRLFDYMHQIRRWNIGYFQTLRRYGIWPSIFWLSNGMFSLEVFATAIFYSFLPVIALLIFLPDNLFQIPLLTPFDLWLSQEFRSLFELFIVIFLMDYSFTLAVAVYESRPSIAFYGLGFIFLRIVDSLVYLSSIPAGLLTKSSGRWISPTRR